ncbi:MAG: dimethylsulfonioproprionate lyase family protein, partial [Desulfohalobium sp.]
HPKTPVVHREPCEKPVCAYLQRALDQAPATGHGSIRSLAAVRAGLHWEYGYKRLPQHLARKYAYAECVGPRGPVVANNLILGLVLLAPGTTYPTHAHQTITESYIGLSGAFSENDAGVFGPGSLILNPPGRRHRITVDSYEPCLLAFAWTGDSRDLDDPGMCFSAGTPQAL